jgi:large subunit ribosomal protein L35
MGFLNLAGEISISVFYFGVECYLCAPFFNKYIFVMPKMKTHSSAKKRFKVTGTGKVKRNRARMRHLMRKKTTKAKRHLRSSVVTHVADHARLERLLTI